MAHGLLHSSKENEELEDIGERYIKELRWRCFLQDAGHNIGPYPKVKMHDLVHDLALSVVKLEFCNIGNKTGHNTSAKVRHISISGKELSLDEVQRSLCDQKNLRTIIMDVSSNFQTASIKILDEMCRSRFKYLRVLELRNTSLKELPSSIGKLKHLRNLDLTGNSVIEELPDSICKLHNLQDLRVERCHQLKNLPGDIGNLINLRFLKITSQQMDLPDERIGSLTSLRYLGIGACPNFKFLGEEMKHLTALRTLSIWDCNMECLTHNIRHLTMLETLTIEHVSFRDSMESQEDIQDLRFNLRWLFLNNIPSVETLPRWLQGAASTLQFLGISLFHSLRELPEWLQNFTLLQRLVIKECPKLLTLPEGMHRLTALKDLRILDCPQLKTTWQREIGADSSNIAHVPEISNGIESISESGSQPDGIWIPLNEYERLKREIDDLKEENRVLQDKVLCVIVSSLSYPICLSFYLYFV